MIITNWFVKIIIRFTGIKVSGKFKHSRPFQDYKEFLPPPKNELDVSDVKKKIKHTKFLK